MQPTNPELLSQGHDSSIRRPTHPQQHPPIVTRSLSGIRRLRSDESWIEVSSQPSSSSLSSATTEDIVPNGLRIQQDIHARRRRRLRRSSHPFIQGDIPTRPVSAAGSSQEEYEESESESDRLLSSSNEEMQPRMLLDDSPLGAPSSGSDEVISPEDDDDENSTALGVNTIEPIFTPQPNAFSHPPASQTSRQAQSAAAPGSYFPVQRANTNTTRPSTQRHSYPTQRTRSHTPYNMISPSHQADHDAALRASLSTLLSCAAAARGLSKREEVSSRPNAGPSNRIEPSSLRMVPESAILASSGEHPPPLPRRPSLSSSESSPKGKRKSSSRDRRDVKKKRRGSVLEEVVVSPTLMTWFVGAGVVVLFSAISFSAGFAYGKEVGIVEAGLGNAGDGMNCGKEVGRGLRRLRWGNASVVRV